MAPDELHEIVEHLRAVGTDVADVEAKAATAALPVSVRETLSAFSNTNGGVIILGLDESRGFSATGVEDPKKISSDLASMCSDSLEPPLRPLIEVHRVDGVDLVTAEVPALDPGQRPCFYRGAGMNRGSYVRVADGDRVLSTFEVQMMLASRGQPVEDLQPVDDAGVESLDARLVSEFVARLRQNRPYATRDLDDVGVLLRAKVLARRHDGTASPTVAGLLALGSYPQEHFPQLLVTFVSHPSEQGESAEGVRFLDNVSLEGPIPVIVRDALVVLRRNMSRRSVVAGAGRKDQWEYPETALREAVVNALVHRDLSPASRGTQVQIDMYPDRLEIQNPGGLFGPVHVTNLGDDGVSSARNSALLRILEDVPIPGEDRTVCENRGSGIKAMLRSLRSAGLALPVFRDAVSVFRVVFPNHALLSESMVGWIASLSEVGLSDSQVIGLAMLREQGTIDNPTYRTATGIDSRVATGELQDLVARELVTQIGRGRWATYRLADRVVDGSVGGGRRRSPANRRTEVLVALGADTMSRAELAHETGLSDQVVSRWLRILAGDGLVERVGPAAQSKNTRYRRIGDPDVGPEQQALDIDP